MLTLVKGLDHQAYTPRCYIAAATDRLGLQKAQQAEAGQGTHSLNGTLDVHYLDVISPFCSWKGAITGYGTQNAWVLLSSLLHEVSLCTCNALYDDDADPKESPFEFKTIPRSREVGQSYFTSIWTTLVAILAAMTAVFRFNPDLVRHMLSYHMVSETNFHSVKFKSKLGEHSCHRSAAFLTFWAPHPLLSMSVLYVILASGLTVDMWE